MVSTLRRTRAGAFDLAQARTLEELAALASEGRLTEALIPSVDLLPHFPAERIDLATGRPVEKAGIRYERDPVAIYPGNLGLHNWTAMAFSPKTGLAYIPTMDSGGVYGDAGVDARKWRHVPGQFNSALGPNYGPSVPNTAVVL